MCASDQRCFFGHQLSPIKTRRVCYGLAAAPFPVLRCQQSAVLSHSVTHPRVPKAPVSDSPNAHTLDSHKRSLSLKALSAIGALISSFAHKRVHIGELACYLSQFQLHSRCGPVSVSRCVSVRLSVYLPLSVCLSTCFCLFLPV